MSIHVRAIAGDKTQNLVWRLLVNPSCLVLSTDRGSLCRDSVADPLIDRGRGAHSLVERAQRMRSHRPWQTILNLRFEAIAPSLCQLSNQRWTASRVLWVAAVTRVFHRHHANEHTRFVLLRLKPQKLNQKWVRQCSIFQLQAVLQILTQR